MLAGILILARRLGIDRSDPDAAVESGVSFFLDRLETARSFLPADWHGRVWKRKLARERHMTAVNNNILSCS